ncbi:GntR family transcriptional regulator [Metasolibacillus sp. FSL H7-0170]|uniref:GntR family transcriptional regulator n=1 Tax=Metasolibacillus TaxID=2703677 RepID=UPI000793E0D8|nr:GntR family transcriptional regulator [Metasolibacillus fluoroglycofenilyticus]KYG89206.1 hypothetical protein A0U40_12760 [[Bacillus] sp. KCTC 13219]
MAFEKEHGETSEQIYNLIKEQIFSWELKPGQKLNLSQMAKEMNVSTIPIREALSRLQDSKLVLLVPNKGYQVSNIIDEVSMKKMAEFRLMLELEALKIVIRNNNLGFIDKLETLNAAAKSIDLTNNYTNILAFNNYDNQFHLEIMYASENSYLIESYERLYCHLHIARFYYQRGAVDQDEATTEHDWLIESLRNRDVEMATTHIKKHISQGYLRLLQKEGE